MKPNVTVAFDADIRPTMILPGGGRIRACCDMMIVLGSCANGCCAMTWCQAGHAQILIKDRKVVATSA